MSNNQHQRARRHYRVRKSISGTPQRPRLAVFRSNRHITAQVIDDVQGRTLASASSLDSELRSGLKSGANVDAARQVGELIAKRAVDAGVKDVMFDRGGFIYHGRVKALADAAREGGLSF